MATVFWSARASANKGRAVQGTLWKETTIHAPKLESVFPQLRRVQEKARASKDEQFTSLAHYLTGEGEIQ